MTPTDDPLVGDEVVRVSLETFEVDLRFQRSTLEIGCEFTIVSGSQREKIDPESHTGNIFALWNLIGTTVQSVEWDEALSIRFSNGSMIQIPPTPGRQRGAILGPGDSYEEF